MKCKTFKIHLSDEVGAVEEERLNMFLENLNVQQIFSSVVGEKFWSVLVFYNDDPAVKTEETDNLTSVSEETLKSKTVGKQSKTETAPADPICLSAAEEKIYVLLRGWRNEHSAREGLPPYMIAHNDSLMLMAKNNPQTLDDLMQIKGFGEKRAQKYGEEILQIISAANAEPDTAEF